VIRATGILMAVFFLLFASVDFSAAKRLGGGGSIGNRQSFSQSTTRPSEPGGSTGFFGSQQSARPNPAMGAPGTPPNSGGFFSRPGIGGMLGGLLVGGLVGSMLSGGGGGMGHSGPGLLDLILIGGGLFLLFKFLRSRRNARETVPPMARGYEPEPTQPIQTPAYTAAGSGWGNLGSTPAGASGPTVPENFDTVDFLAGAKTIFARLQRSWSARDLNDIAAFATPVFMEDVRRQAAADPTPTPTDVLLVDARMLEVRTQGQTTLASAYFDTLLREDPKAEHPEQVREIWHFVRRDDIPGDMWRLDAIQQLNA